MTSIKIRFNIGNNLLGELQVKLQETSTIKAQYQNSRD